MSQRWQRDETAQQQPAVAEVLARDVLPGYRLVMPKAGQFVGNPSAGPFDLWSLSSVVERVQPGDGVVVVDLRDGLQLTLPVDTPQAQVWWQERRRVITEHADWAAHIYLTTQHLADVAPAPWQVGRWSNDWTSLIRQIIADTETVPIKTPVAASVLDEAERALGMPLGDQLRGLFGATDGLVGAYEATIYPLAQTLEYQQDYQIGRYLPGFVAFAYDMGDGAWVVDTRQSDAPVFWVSLGDLDPDELTTPVAPSVAAWVEDVVTPIATVQQLVPTSKFDLAGMACLSLIDVRKVEPILLPLLEWIRDYNWPVAHDLCNVLPRFHEGLTPIIKTLLQPQQYDEIWKYGIIQNLLPAWPDKSLELVVDDIKRIAATPTASEHNEEVDEVATEFLDRLKHAQRKHAGVASDRGKPWGRTGLRLYRQTPAAVGLAI